MLNERQLRDAVRTRMLLEEEQRAVPLMLSTGVLMAMLEDARKQGWREAALEVDDMLSRFKASVVGNRIRCEPDCHEAAYTHAARWLTDIAAGVRKPKHDA